ncbi:4-hydroxy-4-methyl-2-oxoglutarate aldolase/4-carboxy-4-hydroxy-2-oxoadipate aldolase [bacterium HR40]|nr:4-hydroxy-4-methyl-2-oxoglutarate aldolase/4-carboxy-4-hydroxy-2-oxoadipate aldolase [bacterium HR40]
MIGEPPLLRVRRRFERPELAEIERLRGVQTGHLADAMSGRGALAPTIRPVLGEEPQFSRVLGIAIPCACAPNDNLALCAALALAGPGDVLVVATEGFTGSAICGDILAGMARNRGVVGIVTDGAVRDRAGLRQVGLPVFAAAITPNSCMRNGPGTVGLPVVIGGVAVAAGDVVVADEEGVVVVPRAELATVLQRLAAVQAAERAMLEQVATGLDLAPAMAELLASPRIEWIEEEEGGRR